MIVKSKLRELMEKDNLMLAWDRKPSNIMFNVLNNNLNDLLVSKIQDEEKAKEVIDSNDILNIHLLLGGIVVNERIVKLFDDNFFRDIINPFELNIKDLEDVLFDYQKVLAETIFISDEEKAQIMKTSIMINGVLIDESTSSIIVYANIIFSDELLDKDNKVFSRYDTLPVDEVLKSFEEDGNFYRLMKEIPFKEEKEGEDSVE